MNHPEIVLILARADNGVIGKDDSMPWHIPADLRHFKELTQGLPMIMGRKTFDSLPGLLEGRRHIVLTRDAEWEEEGAETAASVEDAIRLANAPHIAVIGGAEIYAQFLPLADRIELTMVHMDAEGDTFIDLPSTNEWHETARTRHESENSRPAFSFVTLRRKRD